MGAWEREEDASLTEDLASSRLVRSPEAEAKRRKKGRKAKKGRKGRRKGRKSKGKGRKSRKNSRRTREKEESLGRTTGEQRRANLVQPKDLDTDTEGLCLTPASRKPSPS